MQRMQRSSKGAEERRRTEEQRSFFSGCYLGRSWAVRKSVTEVKVKRDWNANSAKACKNHYKRAKRTERTKSKKGDKSGVRKRLPDGREWELQKKRQKVKSLWDKWNTPGLSKTAMVSLVQLATSLPKLLEWWRFWSFRNYHFNPWQPSSQKIKKIRKFN